MESSEYSHKLSIQVSRQRLQRQVGGDSSTDRDNDLRRRWWSPSPSLSSWGGDGRRDDDDGGQKGGRGDGEATTRQRRGDYKARMRHATRMRRHQLWRRRWQGQRGNLFNNKSDLCTHLFCLISAWHWSDQYNEWVGHPDPKLLKLDPIWFYFCISNHNIILNINSYGDTHHSSWTKRNSFVTQMRPVTTKRRTTLEMPGGGCFWHPYVAQQDKVSGWFTLITLIKVKKGKICFFLTHHSTYSIKIKYHKTLLFHDNNSKVLFLKLKVESSSQLLQNIH